MSTPTQALKGDLKLARTKVENALISARVAERAANIAAEALDRVQDALRAQLVASTALPPQPPPATEALNVRPRQAALILGCSLAGVWKMIERGEKAKADGSQIGPDALDSFKRGKARMITMASVRAAAREAAD
jgi:hypothetical protein